MKFYSWNVNGIRAVVKKGTFQKFIAEHQPDILCLQETKAEKGQAEVDLAGYHEFWNSAEKKGYSGTAIFTRQEPIKVTNGFPDAFASQFTFADELKRDSWNELGSSAFDGAVIGFLAGFAVNLKEADLMTSYVTGMPARAIIFTLGGAAIGAGINAVALLITGRTAVEEPPS
jgi:hypothetical protein